MSDHEKHDHEESDKEESDFAEVREEIVAYLDGELTPEQNATVESRLAADDGYRHELLQLQRTWDMLDQLPQTTASAEFTQSTVEIAALKERKIRRKKWHKALNWKWIAAGLAIIFCGAAAFAASLKQASKPNDQLASDLELLHEFELFEEVDSIEFVRNLNESDMFAEKVTHDPTAFYPEDIEVVSEQNEPTKTLVAINEMDSGELYQLKLKKKKFDNQLEKERELYRQLFEELNSARNRDALRETLVEYNSWLTSIDTKTRTELVQLPVGERIEQIKLIRQEQAEDRLSLAGDSRLSIEDLVAFTKWMEKTAQAKLDVILEIVRASPPRPGAPIEDLIEQIKERPESSLGFLIFRANDETLKKLIGDEEVSALAETLSKTGAGHLEKEAAEYRLNDFLRNNLRLAYSLRFRNQYSEEQLQEFFEEKLTPKQQSALDWLPPEERHRLLGDAYGEFAIADKDVPTDWDPIEWKKQRDRRRDERRRGGERSRGRPWSGNGRPSDQPSNSGGSKKRG